MSAMPHNSLPCQMSTPRANVIKLFTTVMYSHDVVLQTFSVTKQ
jgi:hypothetical protein